MIVLGIHSGHDSSAAIVKDGIIVADVQEERFTRIKHSNNIPLKSIEYCLKSCSIKNINEVDRISFSWMNNPRGIDAVFALKKKATKEKIIRDIAKTFFKKSFGMSTIEPPIYYSDYKLHDEAKFVNNEHHLAHAACAYYTQTSTDPFLVFTIDGAGDNVCTAIWFAEGNHIKPLKKYYKEAAIGWAYSIVTEALHWWHGDGEGKTMGLAPYGDWRKCRGVLDKYFPVFDNENLVKESELGKASYWHENGSTHFHFKEAYEVEKIIEKFGRENVASEAQRKLEDCVMNLVFGWARKMRIDKIACAGGVFLNVKLNQRIWSNRAEIIKVQHVFPNPGDSGLAVGAALLEYYRHNKFKGYSLRSLYCGPEYTNEQIEKILKLRKLEYKWIDNPAKMAAEYLAQNKIVAWFQGKMEAGPRALGNRSILMSPIRAENKDIINASVKFREAFRPFCPSLIWEKKDDYLVDSRDEYFMITSFDVSKSKRDRIPAVVHVDGSVRPQMVLRETNPLYWQLIHEFGGLTGEYIILNTSFNVMGEPIINNPMEALKCFFDSGIDVIFLGNYLLEK